MNLTQKYRRLIVALCSLGMLWFGYNAAPANNNPEQKEIASTSQKSLKEEVVAALSDEESVVVKSFAYQSEYVSAQNEKIGKQCDEIIKNLEKRYGKPEIWTRFPVFFSASSGGRIAGYTSYIYPVVAKVVVYQSFEVANGGTLDHELTHAFFFYYFQSSFDLFLNEGLAQNSEYQRRKELRYIVYRRYSNGEFWNLDKLYGRNAYDGGLLMYHESFSVVDFLIARGGSRWFAAFVENLTKKTKNIDKSLNYFYGYKNLEELQTEWIKYVENGQNRKSVEPVF